MRSWVLGIGCWGGRTLIVMGLLLSFTVVASANDNELSAKEKREGWQLIFDGKTLNGWMTSSGTPSKVPVEDGCIQPHGAGGYMMVYEKPLTNFILTMDYKISKGCNSGVFVRTYSLTPRPGKDVGFNGIEIAIDDTYGTDYHDPGAIYDLSKPFKQAQKPAGEWNHMVIRADGPHILVDLNKNRVNYVNLDQFTEPNTRPDLTKHKFDIAYKDHPRTGYIGLQDHGSPCWYKNIKLKKLKD